MNKTNLTLPPSISIPKNVSNQLSMEDDINDVFKRASSSSSQDIPSGQDSSDIFNQFNWDLHVSDELAEDDDDDDQTSTRKYPNVFRWNGEGTDVSVSGSFNNWRTNIPLVKCDDEFFTVVNVPEGTYQYKFLVDDKWMCHPSQPTVSNDLGGQNNIVTIKSEDCDIHHVLQTDSLGGTSVDPSSSPPGVYSQFMPSRDVSFGFTRFGPPLLPPQILDTVLNKVVPAHCDPSMLPKPNHVVINHLYTLSIKNGVMVLSSTLRYRQKYVTTLLYKPI